MLAGAIIGTGGGSGNSGVAAEVEAGMPVRAVPGGTDVGAMLAGAGALDMTGAGGGTIPGLAGAVFQLVGPLEGGGPGGGRGAGLGVTAGPG